MIPLTMVKVGETVRIRKITGKDEFRQHLAELGFVIDDIGQNDSKPHHDIILSNCTKPRTG